MKKNKLLFFIFISVIALYGIFLYISDIYFEHKKELVIKNKLSKMETHYKIFQHNLTSFADYIFNDKIYKDTIVEIISNASNTNDKKTISELRTKLYEKLKGHYSYLKSQGVLQYHFVLTNNISFLRMHKPSKYGDDLTNIREDYKYVNEHKKISRGFSHGRVAHGFRNVYPLFDKKGNHIGAMEVSFSTEKLAEHLKSLSGIHSHFIIRKDIFEEKAWDRKDMVLKYRTSKENKNYMMHVFNKNKHLVQEDNLKSIAKVKNQIDQKLKLNEKFSVFTFENYQSMIITFYPIKQNITKKTVAWVVSYENSNVIDQVIRNSSYIKILIFFLFLSMGFIVYKYLLQNIKLNDRSRQLHNKTQEQEVLLSLFDKGDSVLFKWKNDQKWSVEYVSLSISDLLEYDVDDFLKTKPLWTESP